MQFLLIQRLSPVRLVLIANFFKLPFQIIFLLSLLSGFILLVILSQFVLQMHGPPANFNTLSFSRHTVLDGRIHNFLVRLLLGCPLSFHLFKFLNHHRVVRILLGVKVLQRRLFVAIF